MKKIDNIWVRINALVPNPDCDTRDGEIIKWKDKRKKPTEDKLLAVDVKSIISLPAKFSEINVERSRRMNLLVSINPAENSETYMNYLACKKVVGTITTQEEILLTDLLAIFEASLTISSDMASDIDPANYDVKSNSLWP